MAATSLYHNLAKLGRVKLPSGTAYALIDYNGRELIAPIFSESASYSSGDYVVYDDNLYRFVSDHAAGEWDVEDVDQVTVGSELKRIESAIVGGIHYVGKTTTPLYDGASTNPISINGSSYSAVSGDMVIVNRSAVASTYAVGTAYGAHEYLVNSGVYYITNDAITSGENTSFNAIKGKLDVMKSDPEYIFDGSVWNLLGAIAEGLGDLAFKDKAQGSYTAPTGSGSVTVKEYSADTSKLDQTTITGVDGTESVSKMTAGTAVAVATVGTAVRYGTADVGSAVTYGTANKAANATTVGNANVGEAVTYGNANVAGTATTVGNADVGSAVTVATAGTEVVYGTADVGTAVTYGTANPDTPVSGIAKVGSSKTFTIAGISAAMSSIEGEEDCLVFSTASTDSVIGIADTTGVSITPAVASNTTLTPAKAADTTRKLTPVGGTTSITPAVSSSTSIYGAVASTTTLTPAVASSTSIYGAVDSTSTLTPAVAAPNDQTLIPAVDNGTIVPWTESAKTVAKAAASATTVAIGTLSSNGTGDSVATGLTSSDSAKTVSVGTTTGTVEVE